MTTAVVPKRYTPAEYELKALLLWQSFSVSDRTGIRFGLFPHQPVTEAEQEGYNGQELCVQLMKLAGA